MPKATVQPLVRKQKAPKKRTAFKRFQSDLFHRVGESWRAPRGIDGKFRRKFRGTARHVNIGFGTDNKTKHLLPNGFLKFRVFNASEVDLLMMNNRTHCVEIARTVALAKRREILQRCLELNIRCINPGVTRYDEEEGAAE
jgi:large subunit ribosomal protein L32e